MKLFNGFITLTSEGGCIMDLEQLVVDSQNGDIESFIDLLRGKDVMFYKIAYTYTHNTYDSEDCVAESSVIAFDKIKQLKDPKKFYSWYTTILINLCRKNYKLNKTKIEFKEDIIKSFNFDFTNNNTTNEIENKILLETILQSINNDERTLLIMKYIENYTLKEIAEIVKIPENTVKTKIYRTIKSLKNKFRRDMDE